jgi:hypothetical protein
MMKREMFPIAKIYVPIARRASLKPETVDELAQSILETGMKNPILMRLDGDRYVLVEGCTGSKPANSSAKPRSQAIWCRRGAINLPIATPPRLALYWPRFGPI